MRLRLGIASLVAATALLAPAAARASELEVYSNTQLNVQNQWRDGSTTTVVPLYEFLTLSGRNVEIPGGQLYFQVDGWGAANLGSNPWWNGYTNSGSWSGDLNLAYVQARFLANQLRVTLGRQTVGYGNSRMLQLDGGSFQAVIHKMFTLDGYVGVPSTQRFTAYGNIYSANPTIGDLAVGGRLGFAWTTWLNAGFSAAFSWDKGEATREDLAVDLKFSPVSWAYLLGYVDWSLFANGYFGSFGAQIADSNVSLVFPVTPFLQFTGEYAYTVPSLALPYNSILWVFTDGTHQYVGGSARVGLEQFKLHVPLDFEVAYRHIMAYSTLGDTTTGVTSNLTESGDRGILKATWRPTKGSTVGVEGSRLFLPEQGYWQARAFGSLRMYGITGTLDFQGYWFDNPVNAVSQSIIGSATLGYDVGGGFAVVGALQGGSTPYYSSFLSGLVKLTYNATYKYHEVYE
jgi:hypothetical protein